MLQFIVAHRYNGLANIAATNTIEQTAKLIIEQNLNLLYFVASIT